ncbi:glycosyltransferase involved in cell wall biosynthesis [Paenibacillus sp. DS2015]|uniref:glycosyltransferase family 4 protein n=1 Tax=Paenibacillus sp. DS2015 TaxID=3373917 RepID=UPI003D2124FE
MKSSKYSILIISWEYPPVIIGGISPHVYELSRQLQDENTEIHIVTNSAPNRPVHEIENGVHVHRVTTYENVHDFLDWVLQFNLSIVNYVKGLINNGVKFDIIHAHDWLVGFASLLLKKQLNIPLITTIHATEYGRNNGLFTPLQMNIHSIEHDLTEESDHIIVCSSHMKKEVCQIHGIHESIIRVIPNGVDIESLTMQDPHSCRREEYALPQEKIVLFIGRLVKEKGVHILIESAKEVLDHDSDVKFIIAGRGPMTAELKTLASDLGSKIMFVGFIEDDKKSHLLKIADVCVFPSLYEPFGIVAIEAMGSGSPVIVSDVGGLSEIVNHDINGFKFTPGNVHALTHYLLRVLHDPALRQTFAEAGRRTVVSRYDWKNISILTKEVYHMVDAVSI